MTRLDERYRDVLPAHADAETLHVVEDLDTVCALSAPPPPHLCATMDRALHEQMSELGRRQATTRRILRPAWTRRPMIKVIASHL